MPGKTQSGLPLSNRRILLASSAKVSSKLSLGLRSLGGEVTIVPVIVMREIRESRDLKDSLAKLNQYDWVVFTSSYGVEFYLQYMSRRGLSEQDLSRCQICAVGSSTADSLANHGIPVTLIPHDYVAEGVLEALKERYGGSAGLDGLRFLLPRARKARSLLPRELTKAGARVDTVACYESVLPELPEQDMKNILEDRTDLIVFTSSSTVTNFMKLSGPKAGRRLVNTTPVAALGPITAATAASFGKKPEIVPAKSTAADLIEAIQEYFRGKYTSTKAALGGGKRHRT